MATAFTSPHLTPIYFFFLGAARSKVNKKNPKTVNEPKVYIYDAFTDIDEESESVPHCVSERPGEVRTMLQC